MTDARTYPHGVPCWVDTEQPDPQAACRFNEDAIAWLAPLEADDRSSHWHVTFTVADRDESVASTETLGASVVSSADTAWTRSAVIRDPQGARFTISQFTPPEG